jgi:DNA-binding NtrC family response regulator
MADILILMDDSVARKRLAEVLTADHFQVITSGDAEMGRALMRHAHFDVVIADASLKADDGIEIVAHVRRLLPDAEVIAVTASSMGGTAFFRTYLHQLNVSHYFTVPFENTAVLRAARNLVSAQRRRNFAAAAALQERAEEERTAAAI